MAPPQSSSLSTKLNCDLEVDFHKGKETGQPGKNSWSMGGTQQATLLSLVVSLLCFEALIVKFSHKIQLSKWLLCCHDFVGTIVALKGHTTENGKFNVESICYSGLPYQTAPDLDEPMANGEDRYRYSFLHTLR